MPKRNQIAKKVYTIIETGIRESASLAHHPISDEKEKQTSVVEEIVMSLIRLMRKKSMLFKALYKNKINGGGYYGNLKLGKPEDLDIFLLFEFTDDFKPVLETNVDSSLALLKLNDDWKKLRNKNSNKYKALSKFVDENNCVLTWAMKMQFLQSLFDKIMHHNFPEGMMEVDNTFYKIVKVVKRGYPFKIMIEGFEPPVMIDLIPCILVDDSQWPKAPIRQNPFKDYQSVKPKEELLKKIILFHRGIKTERNHQSKHWSISFDTQERKLLRNVQFAKPAIRVIKKICDNFNHDISIYSITTIFLWELNNIDGSTNLETPEQFKNRLGRVILHMLKKYVNCLIKRENLDFWMGLNLWTDITEVKFEEYIKDLADMITDLETNFTPTSF